MDSTIAQVSDHMKKTPALIEAILGNGLQKVQSLLEEGADPNEYGPKEHTPLWVAVEKGNIQMVAALLASEKIDIDKTCLSTKPKGEVLNTPLMLAVKREDAAIVRILRLKGANSKIENSSDLTPEGLARILDNQDVLNALNLDKPFEVAMPNELMAPIFDLLKDSKHETMDILDALKILQSEGKDLTMLLNTYDTYGELPLYWAIQHDFKTQKKETLAAGKFPCAQLLISCFEADPNGMNRRGESLLYTIIKNTKNPAFSSLSPEAASFLLELGAKPTKPNNHNLNTPFHIAARLKNPDIINRLAKLLAPKDQVDSPNLFGTKPSSYARKDTSTLKSLLDAAALTFTPIDKCSSIEEENIQVDDNASVASSTNDGEIALYSAPSRGP